MGTHVFLATLGSQPQIVTLALDRLLQHYDITHVETISLQPAEKALINLRNEFKNDHYQSRSCSIHFKIVRYLDVPVATLNSEDKLLAASDAFKDLFRKYKERRDILHLCVTGGPRLLGHIALAEAQEYFSATDIVWHLYSSEHVREVSADGQQMHMPDSCDIRLIRIPFMRVKHLIDRSSFENQAERDRCLQVLQALTDRQKEVLQLIVSHVSQQDIANRLSISVKTVASHKTSIYQQCQRIWNLSDEHIVNATWIADHFEPNMIISYSQE